MNKFADLSRYQYGIKRLNEEGIHSLASLIIGFPGETETSVMNTIQFMKDNPTTFFSLQLYYYDPTTPIQAQKEKYELIGSGYSWKHKTMTWEEGTFWCEYALREINQSILLPLYGFSIWTILYLMDNNINMAQIMQFAHYAKQLMLKGLLDSEEIDIKTELDKMVSLFKEYPLQPLTKSV
jgi:p-methyltransferase